MTIATVLRRAAVPGAVCALLLGLPAVPAALAGEDASSLTPARVLSDEWHFELGGLWADFNSGVQISSRQLIGTSVNLEDDLGLSSDTTTWNVNGFWRFGSASSVGFDFTSFNRDGGNKLKKAITVGDTVYDVDARVDSELDIDFLQLYYRWSAVNNGKTEAGFSFGLSTYWLEATVSGEGTVNQGGEDQYYRNAKESEDVTAPIPVVGLFVNYAFTPNLILMANANFFRLDVGSVNGNVISSGAKLDYYFTKNFGAGVSVFGNYLNVDVDGDRDWYVRANQSGFGAHASFVF
jgi:hypothetical protein